MWRLEARASMKFSKNIYIFEGISIIWPVKMLFCTLIQVNECVCLSLSLLINLGKDFIFKFQSYRLLDLMVVNTLGCNVVVGGLG